MRAVQHCLVQYIYSLIDIIVEPADHLLYSASRAKNAPGWLAPLRCGGVQLAVVASARVSYVIIRMHMDVVHMHPMDII